MLLNLVLGQRKIVSFPEIGRVKVLLFQTTRKVECVSEFMFFVLKKTQTQAQTHMHTKTHTHTHTHTHTNTHTHTHTHTHKQTNKKQNKLKKREKNVVFVNSISGKSNGIR